MTEEKKASRRARPPEQGAMIRMERELEGLSHDAQVRVVAYLQSKVSAGAVVAAARLTPDPRQGALPLSPTNGLGNQPLRDEFDV